MNKTRAVGLALMLFPIAIGALSVAHGSQLNDTTAVSLLVGAAIGFVCIIWGRKNDQNH